MTGAPAMALREDRRAQLVDGEFLFTAEDFRTIAATLHAAAGIALPDSKATLVYSRLAKRLRALGLESFRDYCALVTGADGLDERQQMIVALTTNVTRFFREPHHFDHLKDRVLPPLLANARRGGQVRIWSAGCSNGQEPYSIALTILSLMPDAPLPFAAWCGGGSSPISFSSEGGTRTLPKRRRTSAAPVGLRASEPLKITSSILSPRRLLALCSPSTHVSASATLLLPQPLGPTMAVTPRSKASSDLSEKDLKPEISRRSRCISTGCGKKRPSV